MQTLACPHCRAFIQKSSSDLNTCTSCGRELTTALADIDIEAEKKAAKTPPPGTKIQIMKNRDGVTLFLPAKGVTILSVFLLAFGTFWIGFVALWTVLALTANILIVFVAIPFWIVGFTLFSTAINSIFEKQSIKVTRREVIVHKLRPIRSKKQIIPLEDVLAVQMFPYKATEKKKSPHDEVKAPALLNGVKTIYFFQSASPAEQEWAIHLLNVLIQQALQDKTRITL